VSWSFLFATAGRQGAVHLEVQVVRADTNRHERGRLLLRSYGPGFALRQPAPLKNAAPAPIPIIELMIVAEENGVDAAKPSLLNAGPSSLFNVTRKS
jgi:hypothetical protein